MSELPTLTFTVDRERIRRYCEVSGDHNPIHLDEEFARKTQFGGIVAHGMLTLAFLNEMLTTAFGVDWLETGSLRVKFRDAARPGDVLTTQGRVVREEPEGKARRLECQVRLVAGDGRDIITGTARLLVRGV